MTDVRPDRGQTWGAFLDQLRRERDEILCAFRSAEWWEKQEMRVRLDRIRFAISQAELRYDPATYTDGDDWEEVPW